MHKINILYWAFRSVFKNLAKRKFKALFRYLYDSKYRNDISYMLSLVRKHPVKCINTEVQLGNVRNSHSVNYPEWVDALRSKIKQEGYLKLEPIKVILDVDKGLYLVVDGNHRLKALQRELPTSQRVPVKLLMPYVRKSR